MNFNLISQLTEEDRTKIENYIYLYGTQEHFIGIDEWLKYWGVNKIKLYKLLGNQMIYRTPFEYVKSDDELGGQLSQMLCRSDFPSKLRDWMRDHSDLIPENVQDIIQGCCRHFILVIDKISDNIKFKLEGEKKTFQVQKGQKPMRVLGRFLTYCKNVEGADAVIREYEEFRLAHSMILNDKVVKGNMVISIHPLDFMTMSDNNSKWGSCMSWMEQGCYHVGTVEMMNSNNVLCCYLENAEPFYFSRKKEDSDEDYLWYNKKWRQLVYCTKDIIVSGKPYPYHNDEISKALIQIIRDLARKNLGWTYSFGPEEYRDMIHITGSYSMRRAKGYIHYKDMRKHNILFDSKGMYNDMLNDSGTTYWCVRNKVKHNKVISYSGKAPCLCCGNSVIYETMDDYDYNERYANCHSVICQDCMDLFRCDICNDTYPTKKHYTVYLENGREIRICEDCIRDYIRKCPDCGRAMFVASMYGNYNICVDEKIDHPVNFIKIVPETDPTEFGNATYSSEERLRANFKTIFPICRCGKCAEKDARFELRKEKVGYGWSDRTDDFWVSKEVEDMSDWEDYFSFNLEKVSIADGEVITN